MVPHLALRHHWVTAHPVDELLQLDTPMLHELLLIPTGDLLVGQRRNRDKGELVHQPLVQPVEVFIATRHLTKGKTRLDMSN